MSNFQKRVIPLGKTIAEPTHNGGTIEYEEFPVSIDILGPMLHYLFEKSWSQVGLGHMVDGSVLELEFTQKPKMVRLYDGYLTVVTESWHMHLCIDDHQGGPIQRTDPSLAHKRRVARGAIYRRLTPSGDARSWGIQFWNGSGEKMMNLFLPNAFVADDESLLPEHQPNLEKLGLYHQLRETYILGNQDIPYDRNPLKKPYISVCRSGRCYPSRNWEPIYEALKTSIEDQKLDIEVINSGCLEVCKMGPVVMYSGDGDPPTWYTRVTPDIAQAIVTQHLAEGQPLVSHIYPKVNA